MRRNVEGKTVLIAAIDTDTYATLTITDPHSNSFENIPKAYQMLFEVAKSLSWENRLAFEEEYDMDGVHYKVRIFTQ